MSVDSGYEPWARAAIDRGQGLTVEMGTELLATIDKLRDEAERRGARLVVIGEGWRRARPEARAACRNELPISLITALDMYFLNAPGATP